METVNERFQSFCVTAEIDFVLTQYMHGSTTSDFLGSERLQLSYTQPMKGTPNQSLGKIPTAAYMVLKTTTVTVPKAVKYSVLNNSKKQQQVQSCFAALCKCESRAQ